MYSFSDNRKMRRRRMTQIVIDTNYYINILIYYNLFNTYDIDNTLS